jgi:hypothetical protein
MALHADVRSVGSEDGYVEFFLAGERVKGEFHCSDCGYGVTVYRVLPVCPMCAGESWEQTAWSPLLRSANGERSATELPL